ncbi:MAG: hypothetical protein ACO21J_07495 [Anaerohalosphaeraceae bacterium]|jgi:hypothetical protein
MSETNNKTEDLQCPLMDTCAFLRENRTTMPELVERIQDTYCTKPARSECARFKIAQSVGTEKVPPLMLPEQVEWAQQIIEECDRDLESGGRLAGVE